MIYNYKKSVVFVFACWVCCTGIRAQSSEQNYIRTRTMLNEAGTQSLDVIKYYDGLGRPDQLVQKAVTPQGKDLVTMQDYDVFGRESLKWLPINTTTGSGGYRDPVALRTRTNTVYGSDSIYSRTVYEDSPLNRVLEQFGPGKNWYRNNKRVTTEYLTNVGTSGAVSCKYYKVAGTAAAPTLNTPSDITYYPNNQLYVSKITDEDGKIAYEFKDKLGQVVLFRKVEDSSHYNDTYYVYDDFGNLCFVLPPMASDKFFGAGTWGESNGDLQKYAYLYRYDGRRRCIAKKLPGAEWIYYVYDRADRLILSQDGNQRNKFPQLWSFKKYDVLGRLIVFGEYADSKTHSQLITEFKDSLIVEKKEALFPGYSWNMMPRIDYKDVHQINYYDDYAILLNLFEELRYTPEIGYGTDYGDATGLLVGTLPFADVTPTILYYDQRGRMIQKKSVTPLGMDQEYYKYTFSGKVEKKKLAHHVSGGNDICELYTYTYDHSDRLLKTRYKINSDPEIAMNEFTYDELGRIKTKKQFTYTPVDYSYNIRGWLTYIGYNSFVQHLYYEEPFQSDLGVRNTEYYNGSVSTMFYSFRRDHTDLGYSYRYDGLNRLIEAGCINGPFHERMSYDKNGNVLTLNREGVTNIGPYEWPDFSSAYNLDDLTYTYDGNRLKKVDDGGYGHVDNYNWAYFSDEVSRPEEYLYDKNGNMIADYNRKVSKIEYNSLNLPTRLQMQYGHMAEFYYDPSGVKYKEVYKTSRSNINVAMSSIVPLTSSQTLMTEERFYIGNKVYRKSGNNMELSRIYTEEGTVFPNESGWIYDFNVTDNLGSIRSNVSGDDENYSSCRHYTPSGVEFTMVDNPSGWERFSGKELKPLFGQNFLDFSARMYDPALMRWHVMDPLAEKYYDISPYAYCGNNPVNRIDPDGKGDFWYNGLMLGNDGINNNKIYVLKTTEKSFGDDNNRVPGAGLSKKALKETMNFIKENSGNMEAFQGNSIAYTNSVEIEGSSEVRQAMVNEVIRDNGNGGTSDANNREYGGAIRNGSVSIESPGAVANPKTHENASIMLPKGFSTFHSHPSGSTTIGASLNRISFDSEPETYSYHQYPSPADIQHAGSHTHYVFGRGDNRIYIYNSHGVQAVTPMRYFINPKN